MLRAVLVIVLSFFLSQSALAVPQKAGIAVVVNEDIITFSDIANRSALYINTMSAAPPPEARRQIEGQVIDRLIDEKIKLQQAKDLGISIDNAQINEAMADIARQNKASVEEFRAKLRQSGVKPSTLEDQLRADLAWSMVVRRKLRPQINISDSEIENELESANRSSGKKEFQVAELFLKVPSPDKDTDVLRKAEEIRKAITSGKPFQLLARQFSEAPGAATGGDLGWIEEGQLDTVLNDALTTMNPGQLSSPIRSDKGYHLLFLRDLRQKGGAAPTSAAEEPAAPTDITVTLKQILLPVYPNDPQVVTSAKISRAKSLKDEIKSCAGMDDRLKEFAGAGTGSAENVALSSLPEALQEPAKNLPIGTLSEPMQMPDGIMLIMVCDRTGAEPKAPKLQPPVAQNQPSRDDIANKIGLQRLEQLQARYLSDLRAAAVIQKRL